MRISRLDLDGAGSPSALVTRILALEPDLPIPVPVEQLCQALDITSIGDLETDGFEAALLTDDTKSAGAILLAKDRSRQRRRFSIAHELGHFLIPTHMPASGRPFPCSADDMRQLDFREKDRRRRMEVEANRFAALLLIPPPVLRTELGKISNPDVMDIVRLAGMFDVSKEAMARAYAEYSREALAIVVIHQGRVLRTYRSRECPWVEVSAGQPVPNQSIYHVGPALPGTASPVDEVDPITWIGEADARKVIQLTEQVLHQRNGYALLLMHAEMVDEDDEEEHPWEARRPSR